MNEQTKSTFFISGRSWWFFHGSAALLTIVFVGIFFSPLYDYIKTRVLDPILFNARHMLGETPKLSENIKIFGFDDQTFSYLGGPSLSPEDLTNLLINIEKQKPKIVLLDALLSDLPIGDIAPLQKLKTSKNIVTGAYITNRKVSYRNPLNLEKSEFQLEHYLSPGLDPLDLEVPLDNRFDWYPYGHSKVYNNLFRAQGHITYNSDGTISPFYQLSPKSVLPHISLFSADSIKLDEYQLFINGNSVPLTSRGRIIINHRPSMSLFKRAKSLRHAIQRARGRIPETQVQEGDIVLILFSFATGNTDFHNASPFGTLPGALFIASMLSSIELNQWISPINIAPVMIVVLSIAGAMTGIHASVAWFCAGLISLPILYFILSILLFSYASIYMDWLLPTSLFCFNALLYFAHNRLQSEIKLFTVEKNYILEKALRLEEENKLAKLEGYLELGKAVQKLLLPKKLKGKLNNIYYEMKYNPHLKMAGDWFYIWDSSPGEIRFFIGDVMGKGPSAAIPMASIMSALKECEKKLLSMNETIDLINVRLIELFNYHITTTLAAVIVYEDGRCDLVNCGSPGWFHYTLEKTNMLTMRSSALGMQSKIKSSSRQIKLEDDQILFTFTDGYLEGSRSLKKLLDDLDKERNIAPTSQHIHNKLQAIAKSDKVEDDRSLITIRVLKDSD